MDTVRRPTSVLFACNFNSVRSPMAEGLAKQMFGGSIYFDSVGVRQGSVDGFAIAAMAESDIDISYHDAKTFDDLEDTSFDLVISLTPEAQHKAVELTRTMAVDLEYWPSLDPTGIDGSREVVLDAFRKVRDDLRRRIEERFGAG
ncbi:MAG: low molecular weight phosphatase family protein [Rhodospirillaceae bacterium]|jgi:protein-tyrosine-phosphatase|nr:low molecular weight phosphatase family protein [Rhodospirillaceae bacterium]MBT3492010.1 low molecular weight phosphatase family protein [Rhodospirillaceae bacterium]MBT3779198.1 low molecular weight phosphatase family protein [Rhodospirillaceae bacterium]MBT3979689.1 low molecular weight phosphatase family protein [Rhodospirillaceae bacterium]MBT4168593.1 low molecular weight phosphatase family protein [Rhodospirillaceae bacterium]